MSGGESYRLESSLGDSSIQNVPLAFNTDGSGGYRPLVSSPTPNTAYPQASPTTAIGGVGANGFAIPASVSQPTINTSGVEPMKRKRGRPRKYAPSLAPGGMPLSPPPKGPSSAQPASTETSSGSLRKKPRGRPPGSGRKQHPPALGTSGVGFTPHVITVKSGEDVLATLMSFSQNNRAVCILSANGVISNVTLCQASTYGGTVTYEGRFEILSLSGSFLLSESGGQRSRMGGLCVLLAGPDGRVLGGGVSGLLTAATAVQVVVGSFVTEGQKQSKSSHGRGSMASQKGISGASMGGSPPSRGTLTESSGGHGSPINQNAGAYDGNPQPMASIPW